MIVNGPQLLEAEPIDNMLGHKTKHNGYSRGLTECGYDIRIKQDTTLDVNNRFTLASSLEHFQMPDNLCGRLCDKSTWARQGLSVFNTIIEPGWSGYLTLELVYHGNDAIRIEAGSGIGQVLFHQITTHTEYTGKYNHQPDYPVEARL